MLVTDSHPHENDLEDSPNTLDDTLVIGTLCLSGGPRRRSRQHVAWDEDVIDNEGCGRKSSKGGQIPPHALRLHLTLTSSFVTAIT